MNPPDCTIRAIQEDILERLRHDRDLMRQELGHDLRIRQFNRIIRPSRWRAWRLLMVPSDSDFVYFCYRAFLDREPDRPGYVNLRNGLAYGYVRRLKVIDLLADSEEGQQKKARWAIDTIEFDACRKHARRLLARPRTASFLRWLWCVVTLPEYRQRHEMCLAQIDIDLTQTRLRSIDAMEYLQNSHQTAPR